MKKLCNKFLGKIFLCNSHICKIDLWKLILGTAKDVIDKYVKKIQVRKVFVRVKQVKYHV